MGIVRLRFLAAIMLNHITYLFWFEEMITDLINTMHTDLNHHYTRTYGA